MNTTEVNSNVNDCWQQLVSSSASVEQIFYKRDVNSLFSLLLRATAYGGDIFEENDVSAILHTSKHPLGILFFFCS